MSIDRRVYCYSCLLLQTLLKMFKVCSLLFPLAFKVNIRFVLLTFVFRFTG
jgi:hypothetical protein